MFEDFAANLRTVCRAWPSISMFCRETGINRTQFNRYLVGSTRPSPHTLALICDAVGISQRDMFLPEAEFHAKHPFTKRRIVEEKGNWARMAKLNRDTLQRFDKYAGFYYIYYNSLSRLGHVVKGVLHFYEDAQGVQFIWIEKDRSLEPTGNPCKWRYTGQVYLLSERIFLVGVETLTENEIVEVALFPSYRSKVVRLSGLILGVSSGNRREINCSRVVLEKLPAGVKKRRMLSECGIYQSDSAAIPSSIREAIQFEGNVKSSLFHASRD